MIPKNKGARFRFRPNASSEDIPLAKNRVRVGQNKIREPHRSTRLRGWIAVGELSRESRRSPLERNRLSRGRCRWPGGKPSQTPALGLDPFGRARPQARDASPLPAHHLLRDILKSSRDIGIRTRSFGMARCCRTFWRNSSASCYAPDNASGCFVVSDFGCANPDRKWLKRTRNCCVYRNMPFTEFGVGLYVSV